MNDIKDQYNDFSQTYIDNIAYDEKSNAVFRSMFDFELKSKKILDIGCGDGAELNLLARLGADVVGIDPSIEFLQKAKANNPSGTFVEGIGESLPFPHESFDVVISKWALQTSADVGAIFSEAARVLKPGGMLVYLSKHPWMQHMGKVRDYGHGADYYQQMIVTSNIFAGKITLHEPSHTIGDYFNSAFFSNFELIDYQEGTDFPASEQLNGDVYPTYFVVKAWRR